MIFRAVTYAFNFRVACATRQVCYETAFFRLSEREFEISALSLVVIYRERLELAVQSWACSEVGAFDGNGVCLVRIITSCLEELPLRRRFRSVKITV